MSFADQVQSQYGQLLSQSGAGEKIFREKAWAEYSRLGLPGRKTETWKYSSLNSLTRTEWAVPAAQAQVPAEAQALVARWKNEFEIVFMLDGVLRSDLSSISGGCLSVMSWDEADLSFEDGWVGLSAALARPGFRLKCQTGTKPILIIHAQSSRDSWSPVVNQISIGAAGKVQLAEIHLGESGRYLRSEITLVTLGEDAVVDWVRVQQEDGAAFHFSEVQSRLSARANLSITQLNGGSLWCRSSLRNDIRGETAEAHISGLTFARGQQHIDQRVEVRHAKGNTVSTQLFKGVLKDRARGVLNGKILIERDAQKVTSSQMNHNLLLSPTAEADTKPELEIYADDVKANHGASIGRLDENKMFYLMSRGISRQLAQQMLAHAFVGDVLMKIRAPALRSFADTCVQAWLPEFSADMEHTLDGVQA